VEVDSSSGETFFPPVKIESWIGLHEIFHNTIDLDQTKNLDVFSSLSNLVPDLVNTSFEETEDFVTAIQLSSKIAFPNPIPRIKLAHVLCGYEKLMLHKYSLPGFVEVESGDRVIDCGSFVGGFAIAASRKSFLVHAFEPEPRNYACLSLNTSDMPNCVTHALGLSNVSGTQTLNLSANAVEHSYLEPDAESLNESLQTRVIRLDDFCQEAELPKIDFLKLEAEGFEIEVFSGLGSIQPRKMAIDVSPERDGKSPAPQIISEISSHYEVRQRGNVLFARIRE
jgi:FkbM family methyltransferase